MSNTPALHIYILLYDTIYVYRKRRNSLHREKSLCLSANCQSHGHLTLPLLMFGAGIIKQNSPLNVLVCVVALLEHGPKKYEPIGGRISLNASSVGGHWPNHGIEKMLSWSDISFFTAQCDFKVVSPSQKGSKEDRAFFAQKSVFIYEIKMGRPEIISWTS